MPRLDGLFLFGLFSRLYGLLLTLGLVVGDDATTDAGALHRILRIHALLTGVTHAGVLAHSSPFDSPGGRNGPDRVAHIAPHRVRP